MEDKEEIYLTIYFGYMEIKFEFYRIKKIKIALKNGFRFSETVKLTRRIVSSLSNINICCLLNLPIPIMHSEFSRKRSQDPE